MNLSDKSSKLLKNLIKEVNNSDLATIKDTVTQLVRAINDPKTSAYDLKQIIEIDPPLTAKLLKLTRSAFFGYTKEISDIREAIVCIGFDVVKELAVSQKVYNLFQSKEYIHGYSRLSLWKHNVAVAICGKLIYRRAFRTYNSNVYTAGLLHDIGYIVIDQFLMEPFKKILKVSRSEKRNLIDVETDLLGFSHADVGEALAKDWSFPDEIVYAIANHHTLFPEPAEDGHKNLAHTLYAADYVCQRQNIGYNENFYERDLQFQTCRVKLKIEDETIDNIIEKVEDEIGRMEETGFF